MSNKDSNERNIGLVITPMRKQYLTIKQRYVDCIVLFRLGDFYEAFDEDAKIVSKVLDIVLTGRGMDKNNRVPMAGVPFHALEGYLGRLVQAGYKVAICEQLTNASESESLVERDVVRIVTAGTLSESSLLEERSNNYLAAIFEDNGDIGIAYADITTGEFVGTQISFDNLKTELSRINPAEIIGSNEFKDFLEGTYNFSEVDWCSSRNKMQLEERIIEHEDVVKLKSFGIDNYALALCAGGALIIYLEKHYKSVITQLRSFRPYNANNYMLLDEQTRETLGISFLKKESQSHVLLNIIDGTRTAMGSRLLKKWVIHPLLDANLIRTHQNGITKFFNNSLLRSQIRDQLNNIGDIERIINRVKLGIVLPRELVALESSLKISRELKMLLLNEMKENKGWANFMNYWPECDEVQDLILKSISSEPTGLIGEGGVLRKGFSKELDEIRGISFNQKQILADLESKEKERTGIKFLKIKYNKIFGYFIEISKSNLDSIPDDYIRKQTLVSSERFINSELKDIENKILSSKERIESLEKELYVRICEQISQSSDLILTNSDVIAHLDTLTNLAEIAIINNYSCPTIVEEKCLRIFDGRHPVVEKTLPLAEFVSNDTDLNPENSQIAIITGPNMSGKSTYIRQVALIVLLAQIGSFVPASKVEFSLVDRIFTRVGLHDNLMQGESTFMIEMMETASILNQATDKSLIILDEIGRGTSTYDGIAIAQAVVEYIHNQASTAGLTLFATHYHELIKCANYLPKVKNFSVLVSEENEKVVFLRKIVKGSTDKSYGIYVARLAGMPNEIVKRATVILNEFEKMNGREKQVNKQKTDNAEYQIPMGTFSETIVKEIKNLDINTLTPIDALNKLHDLINKFNVNK